MKDWIVPLKCRETAIVGMSQKAIHARDNSITVFRSNAQAYASDTGRASDAERATERASGLRHPLCVRAMWHGMA